MAASLLTRFLSGSGGGNSSSVKITAVKTFLVEGIKYNWTLVKVETDAGVSRLG